MGHTVVFTVPLDPDDEVRVESRSDARSPTLDFRATLVSAVRSRAWLTGVLATALIPVLIVGIAPFAGFPDWRATTLVGLATLAAVISAAVVGASVVAVDADDPRPRRTALARVAGVAVAAGALVIAAAPALAWAAWSEPLDEARLAPLVGVLAIEVVAFALIGAALANARRWRHPAITAAVAATIVTLAPIAGFVAAVPAVTSVDVVPRYTFVARDAEFEGTRVPAYVCSTEDSSEERAHTETIAWMLAPSPLVVVADAPIVTASQVANATDGTLLQVQQGLRSARIGPDAFSGYCYTATSLGVPNAVKEARAARSGSWALPTAIVTVVVAAALATASVSRRRP